MAAEVSTTLHTDPAASQPYTPRDDLLIADLSEEQLESAQRRGARIYADVQFEVLGESAWYWEQTVAVPTSGGLPDVLDQIHAPDAWQHSRGEGVTIAVVDTGVCVTLNEMPPNAWDTESLTVPKPSIEFDDLAIRDRKRPQSLLGRHRK